MKQTEIIQLTTQELREKITEQVHNSTRKVMTHAVNPLDNPLEIRYTRKTVARLKTELKKRELNEKDK